MLKTVFLLGFLPNPRINKRISLAQRYSKVHVVCWDRGKEMQIRPGANNFSYTIIKINAGNDPLSRLIPFMRFRQRAMGVLEKKRPDIIHVQGLDMLQIACKYKRKHREVHIIYEVADLHRLLVDKQTSVARKIVQQYLLWQDKKCSKEIDLLIVTSQRYYDTYFASFVPERKMMFFPNVPEISAFKGFNKKGSRDILTIGYFGVIRYKKELRLLINALEKNGAHLIIAGYEENDNEIETLCKNRDDIKWVGKYDFKKHAAALYSKCDCIYAVYDASMKNCKVALPNKLYEAVYCELPIIVAENTYVGDVVKEWNVGISVNHDSEEAIAEALVNLKQKEIYNSYVEGCKKHKADIDLEKYNKRLTLRVNNFLS